MSWWSRLLDTTFCPGFLSALLLGLLTRGVAGWLGARIWRRPAEPAWAPFAELLRLVSKKLPSPQVIPFWTAWPGLVAVVALSWATGMLPWPQGPWRGQALPGMLVIYLFLLTVPALARLTTAGLSGQPTAALGARRQVAVEISRLLPTLVAGSALALLAQASPDLYTGLAGGAVALLLLATTPWPVWDHGEHDTPLAALGGRALAVLRVVEALEITAHAGLIALALQFGGFTALWGSWAAPVVAWAATLLVLVIFEGQGRRSILPETAQWYTRLVLPLAILAAVGAWLAAYL